MQLRSCFVQVTSNLQSHLPHQSIFLRDLVCLQPEQRQNTKSAPAIRRVAIQIANVLRNTKLTSETPERYADQIMTEYKVYQSESFYVPEANSTAEDGALSIEDYWCFVDKIRDAEGKFRFKNLVDLVKVCLSISHGNAGPERGFSENKHILNGRESLAEETIVAIRMVKESIRLHGGVLNFPITRRLINLFDMARDSYEQSQHLKKAEKTLQLATRKIAADKTNSEQESEAIEVLSRELLEIEKQIRDEECKIEAANTVLQKGEVDLQNALVGKKVKKDVVVKAHALIFAMENSNICKGKLVDLTQRKQKIKEKLNKKKKKK